MERKSYTNISKHFETTLLGAVEMVLNFDKKEKKWKKSIFYLFDTPKKPGGPYIPGIPYEQSYLNFLQSLLWHNFFLWKVKVL